jgi:hypothetical protein
MNGGAVHLGVAAEPATLQLPDQQLELLDLDLRSIMLGASRVALINRSVALGLQRGKGGILLSDDLRQLPQLLQQLLRILRQLVQHQRHGAILRTAAPGRQHRGSPGGARPPYRARLQPVPRQALEQGRELRRGQPHGALRRRRPAEAPGLELLAVEAQAGPIEHQDFHPIHPLRAEDEDIAGERVGPQRLLHQSG